MKTINNKAVRDTVKKYLLGKMCFDNYIGYDGMEKEPEKMKEDKNWNVNKFTFQSFINLSIILVYDLLYFFNTTTT